MPRSQFPISSDQLELLLAFEESEGLSQLSEKMNKDPSVVSKSLKKLAENGLFLKKVAGKWQITPAGKSLNFRTRLFLDDIERYFPSKRIVSRPLRMSFLEKRCLLMIVNAQKAFEDPSWGISSTPQATNNIFKLLQLWRKNECPVVHVRHVSNDPSHPFFLDAMGSEIMERLRPQAEEIEIHKSSASAFTNSDLGLSLEKLGINSIILVGFTASECVDATEYSF